MAFTQLQQQFKLPVSSNTRNFREMTQSSSVYLNEDKSCSSHNTNSKMRKSASSALICHKPSAKQFSQKNGTATKFGQSPSGKSMDLITSLSTHFTNQGSLTSRAITVFDKSLTTTAINSRQHSNIFKVQNGKHDSKPRSKMQSRNSNIHPQISTSTITTQQSFIPLKQTQSTKSLKTQNVQLCLSSSLSPSKSNLIKSPINRALQLEHTRRLTETNHFYHITQNLMQSQVESAAEPISTIIEQSDASQGFLMISFSDPQKNNDNDSTITRQIDFIQEHRHSLLPCDCRRQSQVNQIDQEIRQQFNPQNNFTGDQSSVSTLFHFVDEVQKRKPLIKGQSKAYEEQVARPLNKTQAKKNVMIFNTNEAKENIAPRLKEPRQMVKVQKNLQKSGSTSIFSNIASLLKIKSQ